jgi:hypothetical protein
MCGGLQLSFALAQDRGGRPAATVDHSRHRDSFPNRLHRSEHMRLTRTLTAAAVASLVAGSAFAGGFAQEVVEVPVGTLEFPETSSWGIILPLVALGALVALAASSDDSDETSE